ncbi:hypothetical protein ES708_02374 [subsurface metagenome]
MKYRTATLMAREDLGASGVKVHDVKIMDPISMLLFKIEVAVKATARLTHTLEAISKIELVDGTDVLESISASQMNAIHFYDTGKLANPASGGIPSQDEVVYDALLFGRWQHDPLYAFDPTKYRNPQIRVTYDATAVTLLADHVYLTILADCFDEKKITPAGFFQNREFYRYDTGRNAYKYIALPTDLVLRKLFAQARHDFHEPGKHLAEAKLSEDNDKRIPFDLAARNWRALCLHRFGWCQELIVTTQESVDWPIWGAPAAINQALVNCVTAGKTVQLIGATGGKILFDDGAANDSTLTGMHKGILPHAMFCYPFGDQNDPADWYDPTKIGGLELRILDGTDVPDGAVTRVTLQQVRKY